METSLKLIILILCKGYCLSATSPSNIPPIEDSVMYEPRPAIFEANSQGLNIRYDPGWHRSVSPLFPSASHFQPDRPFSYPPAESSPIRQTLDLLGELFRSTEYEWRTV
ncbi:hypothetical protein PGT21_015890 [Puccinia graminis f. sp. tritici]|uniref:Uncharacterized protein n=1 Tax=Puccinia graminis f. sp. tritici TaxID=56615 RepID=A0A5B0PXR2_PUCGR|nr:hypothetical protein PGT21_015890 [Puccinia graminis f. sp. tritici]